VKLAWKNRVSVSRRAFALLAAGATSLFSQSAAPKITHAADSTAIVAAARAACVDALPASQLHPSVIYLHAEVSDTTNSSLMPQAELLASEVADDMRSRLGGSNTLIPSADTIVKPSSLPAQLVVTFRADGGATRRVVGQYGGKRTAELLSTSFDAIRKNGDGAMVWPDGYTADSVIVSLFLWPDFLVHDSAAALYKARSEFAAFSSLIPTERPALAHDGNPNPRFPFQNRMHRVSGYLILEFVVDTTGHAIEGTVHDVWPENKPRLTGAMGSYYDDFLAATKDALRSWKFYPAYVGTCPVRQIVRLPIQYKVN
jgi:hypothetical protein